MASQIAKKHLDKVEKIKDNIEDARKYFSANIERYHLIRNFVIKSNLDTDDEDKLLEMQKPVVEFNISEAYISRQRGEFADQVPSIYARPLNNSASQQVCDYIEGHFRAILDKANQDQFEDDIYFDTLSGGFSVIKVYTEYENPYSWNQNICVERAYDPTLCGFDPLARKPHKGDGKFCYELFPVTEDEFDNLYPNISIDDVKKASNTGMGGFKWFYEGNNTKIILIAHYYEKEEKEITVHYLSNGQTMEDSIYQKYLAAWENEGRFEQAPIIVKSRKSKTCQIKRYKLVGDKLLESPEVTDFDQLPLIFVDGNSAVLRKDANDSAVQFTRPYIYHGIGTQKLKNLIGQTFSAQIENLEMHKWLVEKDSIPENYVDGWLNPQLPGALVYQSKNETRDEIPPPQTFPQGDISPMIYQAFAGCDSTMQHILGSYDASLGINDNQLSGTAIANGATQSNAAAKPYLMNYMTALNQTANVILNLIPKYYTMPRSIPTIDKDGNKQFADINTDQSNHMSYNPYSMEITVEAGPNYKIEKNKNMQMLSQAAQAFPAFAQFINAKGLTAIVKNIDVEGMDDLVEEAADYQKQVEQQQQQAQQQAQQQGNPEMMIAQLKQQELQLKAKNQQLEQQRIQLEQQYKSAEYQLEQEKLANERMRMMFDSADSVADNHVQLTKAQTERQVKAAELLMKHKELNHTISQELKNNGQKNQSSQDSVQ